MLSRIVYEDVPSTSPTPRDHGNHHGNQTEVARETLGDRRGRTRDQKLLVRALAVVSPGLLKPCRQFDSARGRTV